MGEQQTPRETQASGVEGERAFWRATRTAYGVHGRLLRIGLVGSLTLGLAPFVPHAHVWKQLVSMSAGTLTQPIDIFDLVLHGAPWLLLGYGAARYLMAVVTNVRVSRAHSRRG